MMKLQGYYHPPLTFGDRGLNKDGGAFWIGYLDFQDPDEPCDGLLCINLSVPNEPNFGSYFASIKAHYSGINVLRELEEKGFLKLFEELKANTFYDVVQCCVMHDIPIMYHGESYTSEMCSREVWEILYGDGAHV